MEQFRTLEDGGWWIGLQTLAKLVCLVFVHYSWTFCMFVPVVFWHKLSPWFVDVVWCGFRAWFMKVFCVCSTCATSYYWFISVSTLSLLLSTHWVVHLAMYIQAVFRFYSFFLLFNCNRSNSHFFSYNSFKLGTKYSPVRVSTWIFLCVIFIKNYPEKQLTASLYVSFSKTSKENASGREVHPLASSF